MGVSRLINRNVIARTGRTSMRLEPELWDALQDICQRETISLSELVQRIERDDAQAGPHPGGRTSAIRVYLVTYFRNLAQPRRFGRLREHQAIAGMECAA